MQFGKLPKSLQLYIAAHVPLLLLAAFLTAHFPPPKDWRTAALFLVLTFVLSVWKLELPVFHGRLTATFALESLALLTQGPMAAVLCAAAGAVGGTFFRSTPGSGIRPIWPP